MIITTIVIITIYNSNNILHKFLILLLNVPFFSEIIGYIDGIESPRIVGDKQQYKVFKFFLNNDNGRRVQILSWNDEIQRILPYVNPNHVNILVFL